MDGQACPGREYLVDDQPEKVNKNSLNHELSQQTLSCSWATDAIKGWSVNKSPVLLCHDSRPFYDSFFTTQKLIDKLPSPALDVSKAFTDSSTTSGYTPDDITPIQSGQIPGSLPEDTKAQSNNSEVDFDEQAIVNIVKMIDSIWPVPTPMAYQQFPEFCELYMNIKAWNLPNFLGARIPLHTKLVLSAWNSYLLDYHDKLLCQYLTYGWPVGYLSDSPPQSVDSNHPSAERNLSHVENFIKVELTHQALVGPFTESPFDPWCRTSPMITRDKKDSSDKRIIVDLSFPKDLSVNDALDPSNHLGKNITYTLPSIGDLAEQLQLHGPGAYFWKADLSRAYRQLRVDPLDTPLLAIKLNNNIYLDLCPPFGCRTSAALCQRVANAIVYILGKENHQILAYWDDYAACHPTLEQATATYRRFKQLASELGLQLAEKKCVSPTKEIEWLGYRLNSDRMSIEIPKNKLEEVLKECEQWLTKKKAAKKMIQKLSGKLIFISNCVYPGRKFLGRILATLSRMQDGEWTTISNHFKADVKWFYEYACKANGVYLCSQQQKVYEIECDSSLTAGAGNTDQYYYAWQYTQDHLKRFPHIYQLEAVNLILAYKTLAPTFTEKPAMIIVWTDNAASSYALETGRTKDVVLGACARELWLLASCFNHQIQIRHKKGTLLPLPDAMSRMFQDQEKKTLALHLINNRSLKPIQPVLDDYQFFNSDL